MLFQKILLGLNEMSIICRTNPGQREYAYCGKILPEPSGFDAHGTKTLKSTKPRRSKLRNEDCPAIQTRQRDAFSLTLTPLYFISQS